MAGTMSDYQPAPAVPEDISTTLSDYSPFLQQLLHNRGLTDVAAVKAWLQPDYEAHQHDPALMPGMAAAVTRIAAAIKDQEPITIFADYDCDGIPGAVVLNDFFSAAGHEAVETYIPHRHYEGFGLSVAAVEKIAETGAELIITIDCGTASVAAVARANELGVDVIITDHHEPGSELPAAVAIVNPKVADGYPFPELCGAGVIFKLVQGLLATGAYDVSPGQEKWFLDMVGLATIADMVPLVDENRVFAQYGLTVLQKSRRPGLRSLLRAQRAEQTYLAEDDIGFTIGPRINAASRMGESHVAFTALATADEAEAEAAVATLESLNTARKTAVATMTKEVNKRLKDVTELPPVIVLGNPDWRPSLVGLTASKLAETHNRPAFLWGRDGNGVIKGSCRSGGGVSVVALMEAADEAFCEHGGHHFSGGFSVHDEAIHTLPNQLEAALTALGTQAAIPTETIYDYTLTAPEITPTLVREQQSLAPFGKGNEKPLYKIIEVVPETVDVFGKTKEHTKLRFSGSPAVKEAIAFFKLPEHFTVVPEVGVTCTLMAHLEQSHFMGRLQTRLRIVDIL